MADIFVFGSNLAGRHGAGSAKEALLNHGAVRGIGYGRAGNSFAIPTKDFELKVLPLDRISKFVDNFKIYAYLSRQDTFNVVAIGCGLAGYTPKDIAPMFKNAPANVQLPKVFKEVLDVS